MVKFASGHLGLLAGLAALAVAGPALGAGYIKFDGVAGDVVARGEHSGWIEIGSVSWASPAGCTASGPGTLTLQRAPTANLRQRQGAAIPTMTLDVTAPRGGGAAYYRYVFQDAIITGIAADPAGGGASSATLSFSSARRTGCAAGAAAAAPAP